MLIRNLTETDKSLLSGWIAAEPDHENNTPEFYFDPRTKSVIYEDEEGPVFVVRYSSALRIDMEFSPTAGKKRIGEALKAGFSDVQKQAAAQGFKEIIFSSVAKRLIAFCRLMGFEASPDYRKVL